MGILENITAIKNKIQSCEQQYDRIPHSVFLLAVSKKQSIDKIAKAIAAGQKAFGENYLQEALVKIAFFADKKCEWHFIGPIQSNKTKKIAEHFSWVHSVSSQKIAQRLNDQRPSHLPPLNICIEVNVSHEKTKTGVDVEEVRTLVAFCSTLPQLKLRGLMTIPSPKNKLDEQRAEFHKLRMLYDRVVAEGFALDTLSMGMSDDLEAAIAEQATMVRIGTALFGARE